MTTESKKGVQRCEVIFRLQFLWEASPIGK